MRPKDPEEEAPEELAKLPTFGGSGTIAGVDISDGDALQDLMEEYEQQDRPR
jgi:hypothetical protein